VSEISTKKRPMSSSRSGTWEGLALAQKTLGRAKRSLPRPSHTPLRSVNLVLGPKSARTLLGTRQVRTLLFSQILLTSLLDHHTSAKPVKLCPCLKTLERQTVNEYRTFLAQQLS